MPAEFQSPPTLFYFSAFQMGLKVPEGKEHEQILAFYPPTFSTEDRIKHVGLSQAIISFTRTFDARNQVGSVHSQKHRMLFLQPEALTAAADGSKAQIWLAMNLNLGFNIKQQQKTNKKLIEFMDSEQHDAALKSILMQAYQQFKLIYGGFGVLTKTTGGGEPLRQIASQFFTRYFETQLPDGFQTNEDDFMESFQGIKYAPLEKPIYLDVLSMIMKLKTKTPAPVEMVLLQRENLAWSDLNQDETAAFVAYLTRMSDIKHCFPQRASVHPQPISGGSIINVDQQGFIAVPRGCSVGDGKQSLLPQRMFIGDSVYIVLLYRQNHFTAAFLVQEPDAGKFASDAVLQQLNQALQTSLTSIAGAVRETAAKKPVAPTNSPYRYIYFNQMNLALRSCGDGLNFRLGADVVNTLHDIRSKLSSGNVHEIIVKTAGDLIVAGRRFGPRELYLLCSKRDATLTEIEEEIKNLKTTDFATAFLE